MLVFFILISITPSFFDEIDEEHDFLRIGAVQSAIDKNTERKYPEKTIKIYENISVSLMDRTESKIDFLVWPEYSVYSLLNKNERLIQKIQNVSESLDVPILLGAPHLPESNDHDSTKYLDGMYVFYPKKTHEVFNAERVYPFDITATTSKDEKRLWDFKENKIGVLACYEETQVSYINKIRKKGAELFIVLANNDFPDPLRKLTLEQAKLDSVFSQRYFLRVTKTGHTVLINPKGEVVDRIPPDIRAAKVFEVPALNTKTPYHFWGEIPLILFCILGISYAVYKKYTIKR